MPQDVWQQLKRSAAGGAGDGDGDGSGSGAASATKAATKRNQERAKAKLLNEEECECAICMDFLSEAQITECGHYFCTDCLQESMRSKAICPLCRYVDCEMRFSSLYG